MFAGFQSNTMLRDVPHMPVSYCQSRPADFQMVDMKGPACLKADAARKWNDNRRLVTDAGAFGAVLFLALLAAQYRRRSKSS
jgi:hypothetical protein